jgi:hypothetical protein
MPYEEESILHCFGSLCRHCARDEHEWLPHAPLATLHAAYSTLQYFVLSRPRHALKECVQLLHVP